MAARDELVAAITGRYAQGDRGERGRILDEFAAVTGYHRKHAMRLTYRRRGQAGLARRWCSAACIGSNLSWSPRSSI